MKITELDLKTEGKRYKSAGRVFKVKDGDLLEVETNTYLKDLCMPISKLLKMDFEEIKEMKNPYKRVEHGTDFYYISALAIHSYKENNHETDNKLSNIANYFNNKEYTKYIAFKETLIRKMDRFAWENNAKVIDWDCDQPKYYIVFNHSSDNKLEVSSCFALQSKNVYFTSKEIAEKAIEEFKEGLIKLYTWKFDV